MAIKPILFNTEMVRAILDGRKSCTRRIIKQGVDMRMTIDEAIAHAREVAEEKYNDGFLCHANPDDGKLDECVKCAQEHEQLAEWLEELKTYREKIVSADMTQTMLKEQYNKAIDDFISECKANYIMDAFGFRMCDLEKIADELKKVAKSDSE